MCIPRATKVTTAQMTRLTWVLTVLAKVLTTARLQHVHVLVAWHQETRRLPLVVRLAQAAAAAP